ncbi:MAG: EpsI family protein [Rhodoferax sp.]|uniref:exosortase-associated protein EpsI, B-type n=1 Tax=Rhodoferax sp. TaxID=50421 RepID=UPI002605DDE4|nr:exosortase-associated protein EpsI, B-type [Rhodoferax sp.]MDD5332958.1 EpsI family protein [Rhodoferax sp.]
MKPHFKSILLMVLMLASAGLALSIRPTHKIADQTPVHLEKVVPGSFGDWHEIKQSGQQIVNPQEQQMLDEIYSQTLSKTYVDSTGYRIMLSIAYGGDQSRDLQVHRPEVCYSAQGFKLSHQEKVSLQIGDRKVPAMRLQTQLGARLEPLTYWVRIGNKIVRGNLEQGFARLSYGIRGLIADGLLFRVSSIDSDPANAYGKQEKFVGDLTKAMLERDKPSLLGTDRPLANP